MGEGAGGGGVYKVSLSTFFGKGKLLAEWVRGMVCCIV